MTGSADDGGWRNTHRRFIRRRNAGVWEKLLEILMNEPQLRMADDLTPAIVRHPHASGAKDGNQDMSRTKGAQHPNPSGGGCVWSAGPSPCHSKYRRGLHAGLAA